MKKYISALLVLVMMLTAVGCAYDRTGAPTQTSQITSDIPQTEAVSMETTDSLAIDTAATETVATTAQTEETEAIPPPVGYGSEVAAFDSIHAMIEKINGGELSAGEQKIFDTYGCDTAQLRELTGMGEGFLETAVEWCGGLNYCIYYAKDGQIIAFNPYFTDEQLNGALSAMETWDNLQKNELLLNLEKNDLPTDEGFMYECTFDTAVVAGQRKTYHEFTGTDGIQRIVTNWYGADGNPISGRIYIFDGIVPFSCYVSSFEADMELAKRLGTRLVLKETDTDENTGAETVVLPIELHSQNEDQDFGFTVRVVDGIFERTKRLTLDVTMTNQMDVAYTWTGSSSSFQPWMEFVCVTEDGDYVIQPEPIPMTDDVENNSVAPGEHETHRLYFQIPHDAPDGKYSLICSFQKTETQFDGMFRLGEIQEDIVIGTVIYSNNGATNEIPTNIGYEENIVYQWQSDWFYGDVVYGDIRGSAAARLEQLLTACKTTGEIAPKLSDVTVDRLDEMEGRLPCERGTLWLKVGENIYRKVPSEKTYALVDGYFGTGEYLEIDEQSRTELSGIINYWPLDYYTGIYKNGTLTVQHVYRGDSSLSAVITGIQIDKKEGENNVITLELTAEHDMHISLYMNIEVSSDHFLDGDIVSLDLRAGQTQTVELPYIGFTNKFNGYTDEDYWIDIYTENLRIYLHIDP